MKEKINQEQRAFFTWTILTRCATNKRTISYGELAKELNLHHRAVRFILGVIQDYCLYNELPPLTILVINQSTGLPGDGFIAWDIENSADGVQKVYNYNWAKLDNPFQYAKVGLTQEQLVESIINSPDSSETIYAKVKVRGVSQRLFRQALLKVYNYSCAFCGLTFKEALEASHIIPYAISNSNQRLDVRNGLLLCSTHHKLFDKGFLTVNQDYTIKYFDLAEEIIEHSLYDKLITIKLNGQKINLPTDKKHLPNKDYLKIHQQENEMEYDKPFIK